MNLRILGQYTGQGGLYEQSLKLVKINGRKAGRIRGNSAPREGRAKKQAPLLGPVEKCLPIFVFREMRGEGFAPSPLAKRSDAATRERRARDAPGAFPTSALES